MTNPAQSALDLHNWKLTLAYDGTDFHGWQVQPGVSTIQGELQAALGRVTGESPLPQGSGRTDAGVHALAQVASFSLSAPIPAENLQSALNRTLPASIRVLSAALAPDAFHARHSAIAKTYEYRIFRGEICPPFLVRYVYACPWPMDVVALERSATCFLGQHNFLSFAATDPDLTARTAFSDHELLQEVKVPTATATAPALRIAPAQSPIRTIYSSSWETRNTEAGLLLVYRVRANGFLHHMVRNFVGTMLDISRGLRQPEDIATILAAHSRSAAGPTAPARGLLLHSVEYE